MSDTKWTKGPWKSVRIGDGIYEVRCSNPEKLPIVIVDHHRDGHSPTREITAPSNAHLISAAPDLYEALEESLAFVAAWSGSYAAQHQLPNTELHPQHKETLDKVIAALTKARGESGGAL